MSDDSVVLQEQPVSQVQLEQLKVEWIPYDDVSPNDYNPNRMTLKDRLLLRQSLLEDGWTQPIVTLPDGVIIDGEQRWTTAGQPLDIQIVDDIIAKMHEREAEGHTISESIMSRLEESRRRLLIALENGESATLASITGGCVPITRVDFKDDAHKMISTIRHNRARGNHLIDGMAVITRDLDALGLDIDDFNVRLGMDFEEIDRLVTQIGVADQLDINGPGQAWEPVRIAELEDDEVIAKEIDRSRAAAEEAKAYGLQVAAQKQEIAERVNQQVGPRATQVERERARKQVIKEMPQLKKPKAPELRAIRFFVKPTEYDKCMKVLGEVPIDGFIEMCKERYEAKYGTWETVLANGDTAVPT